MDLETGTSWVQNSMLLQDLQIHDGEEASLNNDIYSLLQVVDGDTVWLMRRARKAEVRVPLVALVQCADIAIHIHRVAQLP